MSIDPTVTANQKADNKIKIPQGRLQDHLKFTEGAFI
jgi:hypothetical protein